MYNRWPGLRRFDQAFGGFDFDANTGVYSNINITTTPGSVLQGSYYSSAAPYANSTANNFFNGVSTVPVFATSTVALALTFSPALTAAGGTVTIGGSAQESICASPTCSSVTPQRPITGGTASAISGRYGSQLAGKRGTVRVYYGTQATPTNGAVGLTGLGLRINPGGTFTSLPTVRID